MNLEKIEKLVNEILAKEFSGDFSRQKVYRSGNRLNFSCPYCGDSTTNNRKKRGNFYLDTLSYKCYNGGCGIFKDINNFFRDFSVYRKLTGEEREEIKTILEDNKFKKRKTYGKIDIGIFFENDIDKTVIPRKYFMERLSLEEVKDSRIKAYIERRNQNMDSRFAWDPKKERLFLFNLTPDDKIIGLQVRNMNGIKGSSKYLTYKLSGIYEKILGCKVEDVLERAKEIDPISSVFGIGSLEFDKTITIFEGPMDSWLWNNSVGLCSLENKFPFDFENKRYWYDWDKSGIKKSIDLLGSGETVFNWGKFLEENEITKNKKWDLNDLVIYLRANKKKIKRFENYFTNDVLDLRYFINE